MGLLFPTVLQAGQIINIDTNLTDVSPTGNGTPPYGSEPYDLTPDGIRGNTVNINAGVTVGRGVRGVLVPVVTPGLIVTKNEVNVYGTVNDNVSGAWTIFSNITDVLHNTVNIFGTGIVNDRVVGGRGNPERSVGYNKVNVYNGGTVINSTGAAIVGGSSSSNLVIGNEVTIDGGIIKGDIYGGEIDIEFSNLKNAKITGNVVTIKGRTSIDGDIYGGRYTGDGPFMGDAFTGNTLNIDNFDSSFRLPDAPLINLRSLYNFEFYNFTVPHTQTGPVITPYRALLSGSKINVAVTGSPVPDAETFLKNLVLIDTNGYIIDMPSTVKATVGGESYILNLNPDGTVASVTENRPNGGSGGGGGGGCNSFGAFGLSAIIFLASIYNRRRVTKDGIQNGEK